MELAVVRLSVLVFCLITLCSGDFFSNTDDLSTPEMIMQNGFPAETHEVHTEDGFILTLHRMPGNKSHGYDKSLFPVFLQHGLLDSSADWIIRGPEDALAYSLASKGYDVWFGNARGNVYSKKHNHLNPDEEAFWDFSWHEIGLYDIPASIDYILNITGHSKLTYIGHSMGTTVFFVMCSLRPNYNEKIHHMVALAPVAFISHTTSPIRYLAPYAKNLEYLANLLGKGEFLPRTNTLTSLLKAACEVFHFQAEICENYLFIICGHDPAQFDLKLLPLILGHNPAGASTKTLTHYAQGIESKKFRQFDYGKEQNLHKYNSSMPPKYDLSKITVPVSLHYGDNDLLAQPLDVVRLYKSIRNKVGLFRVNYTEFNHLDFLWARDVKVLVNDKIEQLISAENDFKGGFANSVQDPFLHTAHPVSRSSSGLSVFEAGFNEIKLKAASAADLLKIKNTLQNKWKSLQKQLPNWQNWQKSFSKKISDYKESLQNINLESVQGYIKKKILSSDT